MITGMTIVTVWVLDQDSAKEFYTKQLGFDLTTDIPLDGGMRWLTVRSSGGQEFLLLDPTRSMLDAETGEQVRALVAKGALSPGVMATTDCRGDYEKLVERGVEFIQPPAERPYGVCRKPRETMCAHCRARIARGCPEFRGTSVAAP
jgi:catechol 2,3-dioxygenase-like lactoylglutathione lyase family enzyme